MAPECFWLTNFTIPCFNVLVEFLQRGSLWQPSISIGDILISQSWQIFTFSSRSWSGIWFEIPDISTLLRRPYCLFFDNCFSRLTILFSKTFFLFFYNRQFTGESFIGTHKTLNIIREIRNLLHGFWIWLLATTLPFIFSI